jgi:hypothetical protein
MPGRTGSSASALKFRVAARESSRLQPRAAAPVEPRCPHVRDVRLSRRWRNRRIVTFVAGVAIEVSKILGRDFEPLMAKSL